MLSGLATTRPRRSGRKNNEDVSVPVPVRAIQREEGRKRRSADLLPDREHPFEKGDVLPGIVNHATDRNGLIAVEPLQIKGAGGLIKGDSVRRSRYEHAALEGSIRRRSNRNVGDRIQG